jgi:peptidoglycan hydrolase-like protein with peptidoglycan-binding domain
LSQAGALALAINNYIEEKKYTRMSPRSIYPRRRNKPGTGMWAENLGNLCRDNGVVPEGILPSDGMNEAQMNDLSDFLPSFDPICKLYRAKNYVWLTPTSIDEVANILSRGLPVVICLQFGDGEWAMTVPNLLNTNPNAQYGHGICALPNSFFMYNGKKAVLIQDSWGIASGMNGRRILTEDWFTQGRVKSAQWFEDISDLATLNPDQAKPSYKFTVNLTLNMQSNDVAMAQRCLGYLKDELGYLFPLNVAPTGYYGGITRAAVNRFQVLYALPVTGNVDNPTMAQLNKIFE